MRASMMNVHTSNISLSDDWNIKSIEMIASLQSKFSPFEWWIIQCCHFGDNKQAFLFFFPFITGCLNVIGARALWAAILAEWSNLILKWIFKGDRPYWWVMQTPLLSSIGRPNLKQFPITCESGPGTPSGHLMMNVALFYVAARGLSKHLIWGSRRYRIVKVLLSSLVYLTYCGWIAIIFISRLYIQAHFIHQCVFGVIFGLVIGHYAWSSRWLTKPHPFGSVVFANFLVGSAFLVYGLLTAYGLNPLWAVPLALKYCAKPEYVSITTQPYFIMVRFAAMALSLGFAISSKNRRIGMGSHRGFLRTVLTVKVSVLLGRLLAMFQQALPQEDLMVYLASNFILQLLFPYVIVALVPYYFHLLYSLL